MESRLELVRSNMMESGGTEEKVEVNQRHLIDKILARYSAEYVLYRELMQNADDAGSSSVEIQFHTEQCDPAKPNLSAKMEKVTFKNDGIPFRPEDWSRLKRIAEGNPDEQKIGAFGVGFYSLFSVCENPFVFSGSQCMAFYFKGDQLFAKRADVPEEDRDAWTSFLMDLREPMEIPNLDDFAKFLSTSMGFTANLRKITVKFDQHVIFCINKGMGEPESMQVDSRKVHTSSPQRMFTITGASMRKIQLTTEKYAPPSMLSLIYNSNNKHIDTSSGLPMEKANIFLRVVTASLDVNVARNFEREMERSTKKKPPKKTSFQLVYTGREELDASENNSSIFKDLVPFPNQGRVFIGFPTHQTTGCCSHMAARFIPSVERESIDFAERYLRIWNTELLTVGGLLCRIVYNNEMEQIHRLYRELVGYNDIVDKSKATTDDAKIMLERQAAHALASFTFQHSTPSPLVGSVQEEQFFKSSKTPALLMTSHGVQSALQSRILPEPGFNTPQLLNEFIKTIPTITPIVMDTCKKSVEKLQTFGILRKLDISDVLKELDTRPLNSSEMTSCMKWWIDHNKNSSIIGGTAPSQEMMQMRQKFLDAAILSTTEENDRLVALSSIKCWLNPKVIPLDMPVPESVLPFAVSRSLNSHDLGAYFGNWGELTLVEWVRYIANNSKELEVSATFSERVILVISKGYSHASAKSQAEICKILQVKKCIPTRYGMRIPRESYFDTVKLFDDLPIIRFENPKHTISDVVLTALGVRKHVELQLVFDRLISDGSWSHVDLVKYLTSVQGTLSQTEMNRLRETPIFTKEGEEPRTKMVDRKTGKNDPDGNPIVEKQEKKIYRRYKAKDLYTPTEALRNLKLPLIDWKSQGRGTGSTGWRSTSDESRFMAQLGLLSTPSLSCILALASPATDDKQLQMRALHYFIDNHKQYEDTYHPSQIDVAFLPCSDGKTYSIPNECFTNPEVQVLGFNSLHRDLVCVRDKLGIRENPDARRLVEAFLRSITKDVEKAKRIFEFMAGRMGDIGYQQWPKLRDIKFIPVISQNNIILVEPSQCYFESGEATFHKELFLYVDFGQVANSFLRSCGVKDEPTTMELASMLVKDPARFWNLSGGGERYLSVLRQIAGQYYHIRSNRRLLQDMKNTAFLVGIKKSQMAGLPDQTNDRKDGQEDGVEADQKDNQDEFVQYRLAKASDVFIIDDTMAQQIFSPLSAPMEPLLEEFYAHLGSDRLSRQIKETYTYSQNMGVTTRSKAVTDAIFERVPIIIYQMMSDNPQRQKELCHDDKYVKRNLKVIQARELRINRKFKHTGEQNVQPTTACADKSSFTIYISSLGEIDYYDIANALCALIFTRVRFNDAIVVERYLTATLTSLRRKGVPVDRILNIRKNVEKHKPIASPPSIETNHMGQQQSFVPTLTSQQLDQCTKQVLDVFGDCQEGYVRQLLAQERENHTENVINKLLNDNNYPRKKEVKSDKEILEEAQAESNRRAAIENNPGINQGVAGGFLDRIWSWKGSRQSTPVPPSPPPKPIEQEIVKKPRLPDSQGTITPNYTSNIKQNLRRAIHSCKSYSDQHLFSPPQINKVVESNNYCDVKPQHNLVACGQVKGIAFYIHRDVNPDDVQQQYNGAMGRFTDIIKGLATVFELKESTLHLFYDTQGSTIAFNMNGSLFMNLRYYLALHETDDMSLFKRTKRKEALIYWFMTICHELAHNFVSDHNSEHEFYMSSFAEVYLESLIRYLATININTDTNNTPTLPPPPTPQDLQ